MISNYCCEEMKRFKDRAPTGYLALDPNTMEMQLEGTWDGETWDDLPFKIKCCFNCGAKQ